MSEKSDHQKAVLDSVNTFSLAGDPDFAGDNTPAREHVGLQKWNDPRIHTSRLSAAIYSFVVLGMNDAAYGALIPYVRSGHGLFILA